MRGSDRFMEDKEVVSDVLYGTRQSILTQIMYAQSKERWWVGGSERE